MPPKDRESYKSRVPRFEAFENARVRISPIFLKMPDSHFRNLLNPLILLSDFGSILRTLTQFNPDVVICAYVLDAYPLVLLKGILRYPLFVIVSGGDLDLHQGTVYRLVRRFAYAHSRMIFTVADKLRKRIEEESGYKAVVMPTGVDPSFFRPIDLREDLRAKWGLKKDDRIVLTLSNLIERKRIDDVIKAIQILRNPSNPVRLIVCGDGPERPSLEKLSSDLGLGDNVIFTGFITKEEKLELINLADIYVIASYQEGLPFSLLEAMACGRIPVCTDVGDIPRVIAEGRNGFLVKPRDPEGLAMKIREVLSFPTKQVQFIRNEARRTIIDNYDFSEIMKRMIDIIVCDVSQPTTEMKVRSGK